MKITVTNFLEQNPSSEADRFPASHEIQSILWKPKVHYRIHSSPPPSPARSIHSMLPFHLKIHFNIIYLITNYVQYICTVQWTTRNAAHLRTLLKMKQNM